MIKNIKTNEQPVSVLAFVSLVAGILGLLLDHNSHLVITGALKYDKNLYSYFEYKEAQLYVFSLGLNIFLHLRAAFRNYYHMR